MRGILADINAEGAVACLRLCWISTTWREFWAEHDLAVESFRTLGLPFDAPDQTLWRLCQQEQLVFITGNRNRRGPDALEAVIPSENQPTSLPVVTFGDTNRLLRYRLYAERVAERLLDYLMRIDEVRGTGRIYVP